MFISILLLWRAIFTSNGDSDEKPNDAAFHLVFIVCKRRQLVELPTKLLRLTGVLGISGPIAFQFSKPTKLHPFRFILTYRCLGALLKGPFRQVLSVVGYMYISGILKPRHIHCTAGRYRRSNPGT